MKAHEAITILEGLSPDHEVTLSIGISFKCTKPVEPTPAYGYAAGQTPPLWPTRGYWTPYKNEITCKLH